VTSVDGRTIVTFPPPENARKSIVCGRKMVFSAIVAS
jgi:hypothetical protein